ncbi:syntaxin 6 isoform X2 [Brevipalpus obovatus]|uniref:syntaxin 6 isoform X2 n=1 Tax=Brevipalpus obovatus TaxID=246614 RepID=UPI003D9EA028
MAEEDPFYTIRDEVLKALEKSRNLHQCWRGPHTDQSKFENIPQDPNWIKTELKNKLRSIDWDLEDLEEALGIVGNHPDKFKLDEKEIANRRAFIEQTRGEIKLMKDDLTENKDLKKDAVQAMTALLATSGPARYTRLQNELESPNRMVYNQTEISIDECLNQNANHQDIGNLTSDMISNHPQNYVDEQAVMLEDYAQGLDLRDPTFDSPLKKVARVLHLTDGKKQVTAAGVVAAFILLFVIIWI